VSFPGADAHRDEGRGCMAVDTLYGVEGCTATLLTPGRGCLLVVALHASDMIVRTAEGAWRRSHVSPMLWVYMHMLYSKKRTAEI